MDKFQVAHEWAMKTMEKSRPFMSTNDLVKSSWQYADAMQAEADKRKKEEAEQKRKEMREMLNAENTFIEREGQHFDDVHWQLDWSRAPSDFNWFVKQYDGTSHFLNVKPDLTKDYWRTDTKAQWVQVGIDCPVNWRNSLRKRPQ